MNGFQVSQFIVIGIHTQAKEESCVATVHNLEVSELEEEGGTRGSLVYDWEEILSAPKEREKELLVSPPTWMMIIY